MKILYLEKKIQGKTPSQSYWQNCCWNTEQGRCNKGGNKCAGDCTTPLSIDSSCETNLCVGKFYSSESTLCGSQDGAEEDRPRYTSTPDKYGNTVNVNCVWSSLDETWGIYEVSSNTCIKK